ncbi:MAG: LysR family transcriptional regulator [Bdellovibrionales bacterium]|nr:LysR family transcriptional regulator [Bdellovibrionales bacterium]
MNSWINYHHLFYFKTIAEEGSVSKAAEKLRVGQPTLSAQLKQFEDVIGFQLFERRHKKLTLTEHGKIALEYSKQIFRMGSEMLEVLNDGRKPHRPTLQIAALDSIPKQIVMQMVKKAQSISPCQITLLEGKSEDLLNGLLSHKIDLFVTNFLPQGIEAVGLYVKSIAKKHVAFYSAPKFKHLRKNYPQSLSETHMILPTYDSQLRQSIEHWAKVNQLSLNIVVESQDIAIKKLMAVNEMGVIAAASHTVTNQLLRGELIEIGKLDGVYEELFLVTANRKIENHLAAKLRDSFVI